MRKKNNQEEPPYAWNFVFFLQENSFFTRKSWQLYLARHARFCKIFQDHGKKSKKSRGIVPADATRPRSSIIASLENLQILCVKLYVKPTQGNFSFLAVKKQHFWSTYRSNTYGKFSKKYFLMLRTHLDMYVYCCWISSKTDDLKIWIVTVSRSLKIYMCVL